MTHHSKHPEASLTEEVSMVDPEVIRQVKEFTRLKWGTKRIASTLGLARNTVRRYQRLPAQEETQRQRRPSRRCLNESALKEAVRLLASEAEGNAVVIQRLLGQQGIPASVRTVQRAVMAERAGQRNRQVASVRFETAPGSQMQIDFGEKRVRIGEQVVRVYIFVAVLGYSRRIFVRPFLSQRHDDWKEGIAAAFEHFGGTTQELLIDNPKAMVLHHKASGQVFLHPGFRDFCKEWGVAVRACAPYRARTKGKTESGVKYVKNNALAGLSFTSFGALVGHLTSWMEVADGRRHGTLGKLPSQLFDQNERAVMRPLPSPKLRVRQRRLQRKVANDCLVDIDAIRYSVPHTYVGSRVEVCVGDDSVTIYSGAKLVAEHRRGIEPRAVITNPAHYDGLLRRPTKHSPESDESSLATSDGQDSRSKSLLSGYVELLGGSQ